MSLLSRWFGGKAPEPQGVSGQLDQRLQALEREAAQARPGYQGAPYNQAGDLALRAGHRDVAVTYYGKAIDAYLDDQQREAARGVANKIIRVHPRAVRTLCTLTWLDLAARHHATALLHLRDYVDAAQQVGAGDRAAAQILEMARVCPQIEFVDAVADALDGLGFDHRAAEVRGWATAGGSPDRIDDPEALADRCVQAAVDPTRGGGRRPST